ncbi:hypothetical protein OXW40_04685 [Campylobacter hepaticus]|uniref:hypothetical protein n=1 Tax=Campylobacter hepaticus TaxID=1813019 RepID=UPI0029A3ADC5|nr:hypothetical protein [Campylobacter hepaticus]MDX2323521.1 hypothetical protein [Campylobacter hepaticus]MDX2332783.1 hypothetical protein [Campylobacter hepaticus]MDX2409843.1 hypothetical protein [Campylobacter hepaticus]
MLNLNIELSREKEQAFLDIAKARNTSKEKIAQALIIEFLEDLQDAKIGEQAYKEYLANEKKALVLIIFLNNLIYDRNLF